MCAIIRDLVPLSLADSPINIYTRTRRRFFCLRERHGVREIWILSADMTNHSRAKLFADDRKIIVERQAREIVFHVAGKISCLWIRNVCLFQQIPLPYVRPTQHVNAPATQFVGKNGKREGEKLWTVCKWIYFEELTWATQFRQILNIKSGRERKLSKEFSDDIKHSELFCKMNFLKIPPKGKVPGTKVYITCSSPSYASNSPPDVMFAVTTTEMQLR